MRLKRMSAVVTGGAQGIGKAFAKRFSQEGACVTVVDIRKDQARAVVEEIEEAGGKAMAVGADISSEEAMEQMAERVFEEYGCIDALVNNAALHYDMQFRNNTIEYLRHVLDVNLLGALIASRAVFPYMKRRRSGSIVNISSTAAYQYVTTDALAKDWDIIPTFQYSLSKAGVVSLTKLMAGTVGKYGIRVNCICPGLTMTEAIKKNLPAELIQEIVRSNAMQAALQPCDVTGTAVYLISEDSRYVTGQVMMVDAGLIMPA